MRRLFWLHFVQSNRKDKRPRTSQLRRKYKLFTSIHPSLGNENEAKRKKYGYTNKRSNATGVHQSTGSHGAVVERPNDRHVARHKRTEGHTHRQIRPNPAARPSEHSCGEITPPRSNRKRCWQPRQKPVLHSSAEKSLPLIVCQWYSAVSSAPFLTATKENKQ